MHASKPIVSRTITVLLLLVVAAQISAVRKRRFVHVFYKSNGVAAISRKTVQGARSSCVVYSEKNVFQVLPSPVTVHPCAGIPPSAAMVRCGTKVPEGGTRS